MSPTLKRAALAMPALALVRKFRRHFEDHVRGKPCPAGGRLFS